MGNRGWVRSKSYEAVVASLRAARKRADMTQKEVASAIGKKQSFIAKIEAGERRCDVVEFIAIVRALGLNPGTFLNSITLPRKLEL